MASLTLRVPPPTVRAAVHARLYAGAPARKGPIRWTDAGDDLVLHPDTLRLEFAAGWMLATVEAECDQTGRIPVKLPFRLGTAERTAGNRVSTTLDVPGDAGLLSRWGRALHTAIWDGVLDALQLAVDAAAHDRGYWMVTGVSASEAGVQATLAAAEVAG
jgi:hypothetical protein